MGSSTLHHTGGDKTHALYIFRLVVRLKILSRNTDILRAPKALDAWATLLFTSASTLLESSSVIQGMGTRPLPQHLPHPEPHTPGHLPPPSCPSPSVLSLGGSLSGQTHCWSAGSLLLSFLHQIPLVAYC